MAEIDAVVRVLSFEDPLLSPASVARVAALAAEPDARPSVVDCARIEQIAAAGLAALLGLAPEDGTAAPFALASLPPVLLRAALECDLAARYPIYRSPEAFARARLRRRTPPCAL